ncbi:hypothetical protein GUJ93_ZPchr0011g28018 [Zizania palustris]|uniref:Uncharacterized protein n=1 Tax=Zizania palustris TaxID=103762 RepID=A0A8J5WH55_ZIZPA|nr:hypothetical protein GUJ93_ZPchr0011g28018 [Zizania palustris]
MAAGLFSLLAQEAHGDLVIDLCGDSTNDHLVESAKVHCEGDELEVVAFSADEGFSNSSPSKPLRLPVGVSGHSWSSGESRWVWIPCGVPYEENLGFLASSAEIRPFGEFVRRIHWVAPRYVDSRSFSQVVSGVQMLNLWNSGVSSSKRRFERDESWGSFNRDV